MSEQPQMEQTKKKMSSVNDDEVEEIEIPPENTLYSKVYRLAEKLASNRAGQYVIERTDRMLKMIEDTAKWSLPQEDKPDTDCKLERPLPWVPFLVMIIILRIIRIWLSVAALMIGNSPVSPHDMVYFIQTRRRKLRSIRVNGLKAMQGREPQNTSSKSDSGTEAGLASKLRKLLSRAICRPGHHWDSGNRIFMQRGKEQEVTDDKKPSERQASKRPRDEDKSVDMNLTFDQMLTKYANENSDDDSDFIPNPNEENTNEESTSSGTSSCSNDDYDDEQNQELPKDTEPQKPAECNKQQLNQSIEIKENGGLKKTSMPKPIIDIKTEPLSDIDSGNEQIQTPKENGPSNGAQNQQTTDVAKQTTTTPPKAAIQKLNLPNGIEDEKKSTPGHASAAMTKVNAIPAFSSAGSPTDFNACFPLTSILKNPIVPQTSQTADAHSTPKDNENAENNEAPSSSSPIKKHVQHQLPQKQNQQHATRYRGKNRR